MKTYIVTRKVGNFVWVRWSAYGMHGPRGLSVKWSIQDFNLSFEPITLGKLYSTKYIRKTPH